MANDFTRRGVLKGAGGIVAGALLGRTGVAEAAVQTPEKNPQNAISPAAALKRLMDGNARYARNQPAARDYSAGRAARAIAQYPVAAILGCADSRVAPELVFDQSPGDLFVTRVAGNYMSMDMLASLEYAVDVLHVPLVMVLGHTNCGAISAVVKNGRQRERLPGHIYLLVDALRPGVETALVHPGKDVLGYAVAENVQYNVKRLRRAEPILAERVAGGKINIVGAVYELASGQVRLL